MKIPGGTRYQIEHTANTLGSQFLNSMAFALFLLFLSGNVVEGFRTCDLPSTCRQRHHPSAPSLHFKRKDITWQLGLATEEDSASNESEGYANTDTIFMTGEAPPQPSTTDNDNDVSSMPSFTPIELPIDGSLVVLLPAAVIAVFGIITSAMVFASSGDPILAPQGAEVSLIDSSNNGLDQSNQCRGLGCGRSQESDLDSMRDFMGRFAKDQSRFEGDAAALVAPNSEASVEI